MVSRFRAIAREYLRTWFLPDLVGSFPFDVVIQETPRPPSHPPHASTVAEIQ